MEKQAIIFTGLADNLTDYKSVKISHDANKINSLRQLVKLANQDREVKDKKRISRSLKNLIRREATKKTIKDIGKEKMDLIKEHKERSREAGMLSTPLGFYTAGFAGSGLGKGIERVIDRKLISKLPPKARIPAGVASTVLLGGFLPMATGITGGVGGYRLGQAWHRYTTKPEALAAQQQYSETFDSYYHDPEFREHVRDIIKSKAEELI